MLGQHNRTLCELRGTSCRELAWRSVSHPPDPPPMPTPRARADTNVAAGDRGYLALSSHDRPTRPRQARGEDPCRSLNEPHAECDGVALPEVVSGRGVVIAAVVAARAGMDGGLREPADVVEQSMAGLRTPGRGAFGSCWSSSAWSAPARRQGAAACGRVHRWVERPWLVTAPDDDGGSTAPSRICGILAGDSAARYPRCLNRSSGYMRRGMPCQANSSSRRAPPASSVST